MKKLLLIFVGIFMTLSSLFADEVIIKVPLDIDGLPNNGNIITSSGRDVHMTYVNLKLDMVGCNDERIFRKWIPLPSAGIHKTITIRKTFTSECGDPTPQVTVHLYFTTSSLAYGYPARDLEGGEGSLTPLIITNVDAVRGYFTKVE